MSAQILLLLEQQLKEQQRTNQLLLMLIEALSEVEAEEEPTLKEVYLNGESY